MKKINPIQKFNFFVLLLLTVTSACKKTETRTVQQPAACYSVLVSDPYMVYKMPGTSTFIDSNFYFRNCSDSGSTVTYLWNFGDGTTSTEKNPQHSYSKRGKYAVKLLVANEDIAYDSVIQIMSVISGQQHISFGDGINVSPVAIEETSGNEFVLLGAENYGAKYYLFQLDSLLKQKSKFAFPATYRLNSMVATMDGNYIFTGSTQSTSKANELIKMKADGTLLWSKMLSTDDGYSYASPAPDGGYYVIGSSPVPGSNGNTNYNTVIIKTDNNGNLQWQKLLDQERMIQTKDAVIENDGVVVAGIKRDITSNCSDCDSAEIVKLNTSGNIIWKNTVMWGLNTSNWWSTCIAKLSNGNYGVTNQYTRGIFYFSPAGTFIDRKLLNYQVYAVTNSSDGNLIALLSEYGNGNRIYITKQTMDGVVQWATYPDGKLKLPGGYSCCSSSWPVAIRPLRNGGAIITGYRVNDNSTGYGIHTDIVLLALDEAGKPK